MAMPIFTFVSRCAVALVVATWQIAIARGGPAVAAAVDPQQRPPDEPSAPAPRPSAGDHTAREVAGAPVPGDESGRLDPVDPGDSTPRKLARVALAAPRLALALALWPVRTAIWARDRYQLQDLYYRTFYDRTRTIGLYPTAHYESGHGLTIGAGFVHHDLLGEREDLQVHATSGALSGTGYRDSLIATLRTGDRLGALELGVTGNLDRRPGDRFYGIGNRDLAQPPDGPPGERIDARRADAAIEAVHRYREARLAVFADARLAGDLHLHALGSLTELGFAPSDDDDAPIEERYDPATLVGFAGVRHAYAELELRIDRRRAGTRWELATVRAEGWLASALVGRVHRLDGGVDYWRYGGELQGWWRLAYGPRVLATRLHAEAVSGTRAEVPFTELPTLGGPGLLRGYPFGRFRDRVAAVATVAYEWDLSRHFRAGLFVDAGRVFPAITELEIDHLRLGGGAAIALFGNDGFVVEASLATSVDGGLFAVASFSPALDARPRWR
jgi:hypothetical protein